jgi:hypothetical protein
MHDPCLRIPRKNHRHEESRKRLLLEPIRLSPEVCNDSGLRPIPNQSLARCAWDRQLVDLGLVPSGSPISWFHWFGSVPIGTGARDRNLKPCFELRFNFIKHFSMMIQLIAPRPLLASP